MFFKFLFVAVCLAIFQEARSTSTPSCPVHQDAQTQTESTESPNPMAHKETCGLTSTESKEVNCTGGCCKLVPRKTPRTTPTPIVI